MVEEFVTINQVNNKVKEFLGEGNYKLNLTMALEEDKPSERKPIINIFYNREHTGIDDVARAVQTLVSGNLGAITNAFQVSAGSIPLKKIKNEVSKAIEKTHVIKLNKSGLWRKKVTVNINCSLLSIKKDLGDRNFFIIIDFVIKK